ncbi:hypothetical protein NUW58_g5255 [Xylaria curta]|uniref:Uncharacterized protein n=1 Tax=Xylaria curta TaxID=42375 RepID=A0ACC1P4Q1_9PEZI|nr:hypothetical protein NUW58_g5255 [Xylaria curta]
MPGKAEGLVLTVDPNVIHKVDTNNPHNLFSMWTVFSKCAESVEQGRRLENLSWRLWTREALCCETVETKTPRAAPGVTSRPQDIPDKHRIPDVPQLSGSVDSVADEEAIELTTESEPVEILRPHIRRQDSCTSSRSRGRERHITSGHLEKMVVKIIKEKVPNLSPLPHIVSSSAEMDSDHLQSCSSEVEETITTLATESVEDVSSALTSEASTSSDSSQRRITTVPDVIPEPHSSPAPKLVQPKKPAKFALGGSSGDESSPSLEIRQPVLPLKKNKMFQIGGSSGSTEEQSSSLKSALHSGKPSSLLGAHKKQTSFSNHVTMRTISTPSDQSGSYVDESAIDDDDEDSEWEDSIEESGKSSMDDTMTFKRVPSRPNLTSQRSLISLMFAGQEERAKGLRNFASHSTPAIAQHSRQPRNGPHDPMSPNETDEHGLVMKGGMRHTPLNPINEVSRPGPQPIMTKPTSHYHAQAALSPRTTRRNMLATELTESLRRQLLWERKQKTSTANAVLKRRHTSHDVANLKQYPDKQYINRAKDEINANSWNEFLREENGGYHAKGW